MSSSNTFHVIPEDGHLSTDELSSVDLSSSRSSSLFLDYPTQEINASSQPQPQSHNNYHKLRTSPKCTSHPADDDLQIRKSSHHSHPLQRRMYSALPQTQTQQTIAPTAPAPPDSPSFISVHPSTRTHTWVFLAFVTLAMVHAIVQGFESMHDARTQTANHSNNSQEQLRSAETIKIGESTIVEGDRVEVPLLTSKLRYENRSANENREGVSGGATGNTSPVVEASATVLTRTSQLSSLISNLGAGDVVECYVVTRMAHLTTTVSTIPLGVGSAGVATSAGVANINNNGNRNLDLEDDGNNSDSTKQQEAATTATAATTSNLPSGPVVIRKSALAFRYRPRVASASMHSPDHNNVDDHNNAQKYFEITLEYGPQRTGSTKAFESMPILHMDTEVGPDPSPSNNKYVSWENEGKVYYSTHISSEWTEAYYMAPITGVVLEKILQRAVDYPRKRPRYQPFEVVSVPSGELIVRSSGSDDFVWELFRDLADLYVEIDPILVPPKGKVQFYVADAVPSEKENEEGASSAMPKQRDPNPNVRRVKGALEGGRAALFYERFYNCATAIKTGDYSLYLPPVTSEPTSSPTEHVTGVPSSSPSVQSDEQYDHDEAESDSPGNIGSNQFTENAEAIEFNATDSADAAQIEDEVNATITNDGVQQANDTGSLRTRFLESRKFQLHQREIEEEEENKSETAYELLTNPANSTLDEDEPSQDDKPGLVLGKTDVNSSISESTYEEDEDIAETAEKAAIAAVEAAENAAVVAATNSSSAADSAAAASEAAKAAKKAADATVAARNKVASEGLISGDGALVTSILSTCFSDPKYGILQKEQVKQSNIEDSDVAEGEVGQTIAMRETVYAYVYLDGDSFFRLNLTAPYWGTTSILQTVPPPSLKPEGSSDAVDWVIFIFILTGTLFGFLVMLHQGGCVVIDKRLQFRWFFKPTLHDKVDSEYQSDAFLLSEEENKMLKLGGGFPHSIGIDVIPTSMGGKLPRYSDSVKSGLHPESQDKSSGAVLLEMTCQRSASENRGTRNSRTNLPSSLRIRRDAPDNVERPSLITTSKPALPQQSPRNDCEAIVKCDDFDEVVDGNGHPKLPFE